MTLEQQNCYCRGPGDWHMNMLQCRKCKCWYHESCVQCLEMPLLCGDRFYIFTCSICNDGTEFLSRLELKWLDVAHLVLFNLTVKHKRKYFDIDKCIMPFIFENWNKMQLLGKVFTQRPEERREKICSVLQNNKDRFMSGKEIKKRRSLWALRVRSPPPAPPVMLQSGSDSFLDFKVKGRKHQIINKWKKTSTPKARSHNSDQSKTAVCTSEMGVKNFEVTKCQGSSEHNGNNSKKIPVCKIRKGNETSDDEDTSSYGILDSFIPHLANFEGSNHPFFNLESRKKVAKSSHSVKRKLHGDCLTKNEEVQRRYGRPSQATFKKKLINGQSDSDLNTDNKSANTFNSGAYRNTGINRNQSEISFVGSKSFFRNCFQTSKCITRNEGFCIVGKRITSEGKIQYLIEWDSYA